MPNSITINSTTYIMLDEVTVNIVDSFVAPPNKTGSGSGEARLYISSTNAAPFFSFSDTNTITHKNKSYPKCNDDCYLIKENLMSYLSSAEEYYRRPTFTHRRNISQLFESRQRIVFGLNSDLISFSVFLQNGDFDSHRFYIGCADDAWSLIRELSIPFLTSLKITKFVSISNSTDLKYTFELIFDNNYNHPCILNQNSNAIEHAILQDTTIDTTEKLSLVNARRGQGKFKANVLLLMNSCPFTNISDTSLLIASHIKPWALCHNNYERVDGANGLALTPTYDKLFDSGYISFSNAGELLISPFLNPQIVNALNLRPGQTYDIRNIDGRRNYYLDYHRNNIFKH